jgi:hypothetical protein
LVDVEWPESVQATFKRKENVEERRVRCESICDTLSIIRGDQCVLPWAKARMLEAMGAVKIIEDTIPQMKKQLSDSDYLYRFAFSKRPLTRVIWIQNYDKNGGAEISNFNCIAVGRNLGFDVIGIVINNLQSLNLLRQADVIIVNNLHAANKDIILDYLNKTTIPWIKYEHDLSEHNMDLFTKSKLNVFISPMQQAFYKSKCGEMSESVCLPLAINPDRWEYKANSREPNSVFIPAWHKCKENAQQFIKENPDKKVYIASDAQVDSAIRLGDVDYITMHDLYHRFETVYHAPVVPFAGDRVIFEAVLSGCKIITTSNAGHTSWDFDWHDQNVLRLKLKTALYDFWRHVERIANA